MRSARCSRLVPEAGSSLLVPARLGYARAFELLVLGEPFSAERMLSAGLINAIVDEVSIDETTLSSARRLATKPAAAVASSRSLLRGDLVALGERIEVEVRVFKERLSSLEAQTAFSAYLDKRAADGSVAD